MEMEELYGERKPTLKLWQYKWSMELGHSRGIKFYQLCFRSSEGEVGGWQTDDRKTEVKFGGGVRKTWDIKLKSWGEKQDDNVFGFFFFNKIINSVFIMLDTNFKFIVFQLPLVILKLQISIL